MAKVEVCLWWSKAASQEEIIRDQQDWSTFEIKRYREGSGSPEPDH